MTLTAKQEKFAQEYIKTINQSEAYRRAYDVGKNTKPETVWVEACKLMANPNVAQRVYELQQEAKERTLVTVESLTEELNEAYKLAKQEKQPSAMTGAVSVKAKIHGLDVKKIDMTLAGDFSILDQAKKRLKKREKPES